MNRVCTTGFRPTTGAQRGWQHVDFSGDPGRTRTCDPLLRRQMLYPAELRDQRRNIGCLSRFAPEPIGQNENKQPNRAREARTCPEMVQGLVLVAFALGKR